MLGVEIQKRAASMIRKCGAEHLQFIVVRAVALVALGIATGSAVASAPDISGVWQGTLAGTPRRFVLKG